MPLQNRSMCVGFNFLPHDAVLPQYALWPCVRLSVLSVCLSQVRVYQKDHTKMPRDSLGFDTQDHWKFQCLSTQMTNHL